METVKVKCLMKQWQYKGKEYTTGDVLEMDRDEFKDASKILALELAKEETVKEKSK